MIHKRQIILFKHDNASANQSCLTYQYLHDNKIEKMTLWPAAYSDSNLIKQLWDHIKWLLRSQVKILLKFSWTIQLSCSNFWCPSKIQLLENRIASERRRVIVLHSRKGSYTNIDVSILFMFNGSHPSCYTTLHQRRHFVTFIFWLFSKTAV